jgi:hypothetical protein
LNQENLYYINRSKIRNEIEAAIKSIRERKAQDPFAAEFYQTFKEE